MKNKKIIGILIMMVTVLNLIGINIYAESNNLTTEEANGVADNLLTDNNIVTKNETEEINRPFIVDSIIAFRR